LPEHFTGKAWACAAGAESSEAANLLFLDADTFFMPNGVRSMVQTFAAQPSNSALSVLPYAVTEKLHEELSLFFNLLMAFGAGGFGVVRSPRLFGQSLFLSRSLYQAIGGHKSVGHYVLENFHLSQRVDAAGGQCVCFGGRGTLHMRMFPAGLKQLCNGWTKAFADGAQSTNRLTLLLSVFWISALAGIALDTVFMPHNLRLMVLVLYVLAALQTLLFSRQIGTFRVFTSALFPIPLVFFFVIFARSVFRRATNRSTNWRGRNV
jgi:4,4'-diaponeurosporenoate glycosyltransferase